jgi:DNA repair exonuclease SbcCD ATPase subunit
MNLTKLMDATDRVIAQHERTQQQVLMLEQEIERNRNEYEQLVADIELFEQSRVFLQTLAEAARKQIASGLEKVVTLCLQAVFGEGLSFEVDIITSRNTTAVEFYVVNTEGDQTVRFTPEESMGGGVVDTVAIGLRYGLLKILNPPPIGPIGLDEPAKMVSGNLVKNIATLVQELNLMFGKQCIIVTHHEALMGIMDNSIYVVKERGISKIVMLDAKEIQV